MKNNIIQTNLTPTKALRALLEEFDLHTKRIRLIEQQFLDLSARVNMIEDSKHKR
ncbi:MAG: hypothetical protein HYW50_04190 [Candidatus Diapherotrites archaeon]|nr:hypothetical protein [Candidatus Diapherotrites archaeon]